MLYEWVLRFGHSVVFYQVLVFRLIFVFSVLGVYWHPFCYRTVSPAQQSSLTSAAYARIGHHVTDVRCAVDES